MVQMLKQNKGAHIESETGKDTFTQVAMSSTRWGLYFLLGGAMAPSLICMWPSRGQKIACIGLLFPTQKTLKHMIEHDPVQIEETD